LAKKGGMMIEVKHIYKKFKKEYIFDDFSIAFDDKKITSIIGPSGCGKTTLLRMIAGLEHYEKGCIIGIENRSIAFVFQEDRLLPWLNVYQNIELVLKSKLEVNESKRKVKEVLAQLNLEDSADMMPSELSGGMQRRVAIARALAYDADIILLDEPFKGMDNKLKRDVLPKLAEAWDKNEKTIIMVTHDLADAKELSDKVYELSGRPLKQKKHLHYKYRL
jgi:NitT/TauT family transport system ATP-binding protein